MVSVLRTALVHTHTDVPDGQRAPEPTQDIGDRLADGLLALTQQSRPIVVSDLIQQLHLDPNNYDDQGDIVFRRLSHKPVPDPGSPKAGVRRHTQSRLLRLSYRHAKPAALRRRCQYRAEVLHTEVEADGIAAARPELGATAGEVRNQATSARQMARCVTV